MNNFLIEIHNFTDPDDEIVLWRHSESCLARVDHTNYYALIPDTYATQTLQFTERRNKKRTIRVGAYKVHIPKNTKSFIAKNNAVEIWMTLITPEFIYYVRS